MKNEWRGRGGPPERERRFILSLKGCVGGREVRKGSLRMEEGVITEHPEER